LQVAGLSRRRPGKWAVLVVCAFLVAPISAHAGADALCDAAALQAAEESGVPVSVLRAIALSESGRKLSGEMRPWPWTLNEGGKGSWFESRDAALDHLRAVLLTGARNVDVGCFQLNHRWHSESFATLDQMIDPLANARYAAGFLARLHDESGDWSIAAGAYHSRTPEHATKYRSRFDAILASLPDAASFPTGTNRAPPGIRSNPYPLLQAGPQGAGGSLFPPNAGGAQHMLTVPLSPLFGKG
jgi:hypothetical protein